MTRTNARHTRTFSIFAGCGTRIGIVLLVLSVSGCMGWVPGKKGYWDEQVRELCAKDGGVEVYETVKLTDQEYRRLGGNAITLPIPDRERSLARGFPYFMRTTRTTINSSNPEVARVATEIVRNTDNKILGQAIQYFRRGGDFPTGIGHDSQFICPKTLDLVREVFSWRNAQ